MSGFPTLKCCRYTEIYSHKQDAYTIESLSRRLLGIKRQMNKDEWEHGWNSLGIKEDTKENEEKAKVIPRAWQDKVD